MRHVARTHLLAVLTWLLLSIPAVAELTIPDCDFFLWWGGSDSPFDTVFQEVFGKALVDLTDLEITSILNAAEKCAVDDPNPWIGSVVSLTRRIPSMRAEAKLKRQANPPRITD